jgi:hypothetical protein
MSSVPAVIDRAAAGAVARQEFGASQLEMRAETAAMAVAARERAAIEARYVMAERHPRDVENFRVALEKECARPSFAAVAIYRKPVGKEKDRQTGRWVDAFKEGPSIRFIETALRCYRNVYPEVATVFDSDEIRICRVTVTDLEANLSYSTEVTIRKEVERKGKADSSGKMQPPEGRIIISERKNSYGDTTYLVRATEDEIIIKQNALLSKAIRTNGQRLLPGDIIDSCTRIIKRTQADRDAKDPDAAKREILDAFDDIGIAPIDVQAFVGHSLDRLQPAELQALRGVFSTVKNGEATWDEIMATKNPSSAPGDSERVAADKLAEIERKKAAKQQPQTTAPTEEKPLSDDENRALDAKLAVEESGQLQGADTGNPPRQKPVFGRPAR